MTTTQELIKLLRGWNDIRSTEAADRLAEQEAEIGELRQAVKGLLYEWDKFTRYGSPIAKASNENVAFARAALEPKP